ncbi:MAG: MltA domain-containing protein [Phycisphaeraceae bacterium]
MDQRATLTTMAATLTATLLLLAMAMAMTGCQTPVEEPAYAQPLPEGAFALRRLDEADRPDLGSAADQLADPGLREALDRSIAWYAKPSARQHFPLGPITHGQAQASAYALRQIADLPRDEALAALDSDFDVWQSVGWDGAGTVFYTGYYAPVFEASRQPTGRYRYPLYTRPDDLASDPVTGEVRGRRTAEGYAPYATRAELERSGALRGRELVYLPSRLHAYMIEVNGSARLNMTDGSTLYIGYAGNNGHDYTSIGKLLVEDGYIDEHRLTLSAIEQHFERYPQQLEDYIRRNDRFVFFKAYDAATWPAGSLGVRVEAMRTLATDKSIFPRGAPVLVETRMAGSPATGGRSMPRQQLMVDQDTGGAIRAAGRADIFYGIGDRPGALAGEQAAEGRLYYLLLRRDRVQAWHDRLQGDGRRADARR